jgi:hypothetical protein
MHASPLYGTRRNTVEMPRARLLTIAVAPYREPIYLTRTRTQINVPDVPLVR